MNESTIDQKDAAVAKARKRFNAIAEALPGLSKPELELRMALAGMDRMAPVGKWDDR